MATRTFNTYRKTEQHELKMADPDGKITVFHLKPAVPGAVLLDFLSGAHADDPAAMANTVKSLLDAAIVDDELEAWQAYIRDDNNSVSLEILSEIAGYASEVLSGGNDQPAVSSIGS